MSPPTEAPRTPSPPAHTNPTPPQTPPHVEHSDSEYLEYPASPDMPLGRKRSISASSSESLRARQKLARSSSAPNGRVHRRVQMIQAMSDCSESDMDCSMEWLETPMTEPDDLFEKEVLISMEDGAISQLAEELLCEIAKHLDDEDLISIRRTGNRALVIGTFYEFGARFFSNVTLRTDIAGVNRLLQILQHDHQRLAGHVRTLEVHSDITFWLDQGYAHREDDWIYDAGLPLDDQRLYNTINPYFRLYKGMPEWASGEPNVLMEGLHEYMDLFDQTPNLLVRIFKLSRQLRNINIHAPKDEHALLKTISVIGSHVLLPEAQRWAGIQSAQHTIFRCFFRAIELACLPINQLDMQGFVVPPGSRLGADLYQHLAPDPALLNTIDFSRDVYRLLTSLKLEYGLDKSKKKFPESAQVNDPAFLLKLEEARHLKDFKFSRVKKSHVSSVEKEVMRRKIAPQLLKGLTTGPFALKSIELGGFTCEPDSPISLTAVLRKHSSTIRRLTLKEVELWAPHTFSDFVRTMADLHLTYFGWRSLSINHAWIVGSSICFDYMASPRELDFDAAEGVKWMEDADGRWVDEEGEDVEGLHEWVLISWPRVRHDALVEYMDGVQKAMRGAIEQIDCGAIAADA